MDLQNIIDNQLASARAEVMKTSKQWTLGELIARLETVPLTYEDYEKKQQPKTVRFNFEYAFPTTLESWRGSYYELAIGFDFIGYGPRLDKNAVPPTLENFLEMLRGAIGKTYTGWKGGDFVMGKSTPLWVANPGNSGDTGVVGIRADEHEIILLTERCEF